MINYDGLYNKDFYGDKLKPKNHFWDKKLHFRIIKDGTILPHTALNGKWNWGFGGIVDEKNNFVNGSFVHNGIGGAYTPNEEIKTVQETVVYLGMFFNVWGHCITDDLKTAWFFQTDVYKKHFKDYPVAWIPMKGGGWRKFYKVA